MAIGGAVGLTMWGGMRAAQKARRGAEVDPEPRAPAPSAADLAATGGHGQGQGQGHGQVAPTACQADRVVVCTVCGGGGQGRAPRKWTSTRSCRARGVCPRCHGAGGFPLPPPSVDLRWIKFTAKATISGPEAPPPT